MKWLGRQFGSNSFDRKKAFLTLVVALLGISGGNVRAQNPPRPPKTSTAQKTPAGMPEAAPAQAIAKEQPSLTSGIKEMQPASVTIKNGTLVVDANNSDLSQILREVSRETGMVVKGNIRETRVFGHYGPQAPPTLLNDLLTGLGYNIVMVGTAREGAPRELLVTSRTGGPTTPPPAVGVNDETELGAGAIAHPPPEQVDDLNMRQYLDQQKMQKMQDAREKQQNNPQ